LEPVIDAEGSICHRCGEYGEAEVKRCGGFEASCGGYGGAEVKRCGGLEVSCGGYGGAEVK